MNTGTNHGPGHEPNKFSMRFVMAAGLGLTALLVISLLFLVGLFDYFASDDEQTARPLSPKTDKLQSTEPPLDPDKREQLRQQRAAEARQLGTYGWINEEAGIARVPIDRAMEIILKKGLPTRASADEAEQ